RYQRDDELRCVAERRVEEASDSRARVLSGVLRRLADQPGQRDEREGGEDELDRRRGMHRVVEGDGYRGEREGRIEGPPAHAWTLPTRHPGLSASVATA